MAEPFTARRRRARPDSPRALAAAATRLPTRDKSAIKKAFRAPAEWQQDAWDYFDAVPEIKFAVWWSGNLLAKIKLYPAVMLPDGSVVAVDALDPSTVGEDENGAALTPVRLAAAVISDELAADAVAEWDRLHGAAGGQAELQRELDMNLDVAAECFLVGWAATEATLDPLTGGLVSDATAEQWEIRSISEVYQKDDAWYVRDEPNKDGRLIGAADTIIRCFQRHPRWSALADCHMHALLSECRLLQVLTGQMYAESMSRAGAGGFTLPKGLSFTRVAGPATPQSTLGVAPEDGDEAKEIPFIDDLTTALTLPIADPSDPNSVVPFLIEGEAELLKPDVLRRVDFSRNSGPELDDRIKGRLERVAHGLNMPVEVLFGHRATTFANADQIDEDEFIDHIEPRVLLVADVLSIGYLRPQLLAPALPDRLAGHDPAEVAKVFVWYDAEALMEQPNLDAAANDALDRFAVSRRGYRLMRRIPEDYAPEVDEVMQMVGLRRGILTAELTGPLLRMIDPSFAADVPLAPAAVDAEGNPVDVAAPPVPAPEVAAVVASYARRQQHLQTLAAIGAAILGIDDPATLPALGSGAPPGPPPAPRAD